MDLSVWTPILLTLGALIVIANSWIQYSRDQKNLEKTEKAEREADSLSRENLRLSQVMERRSEESKEQLSTLYNDLIEARATIDKIRLENENNFLGSDKVYIVLGGPNNDQILLYNALPFPSFEFGIQIWDYDALTRCNIQKTNDQYFIDKDCHDRLRKSELHSFVYMSAHQATNIRYLSNGMSKFIALAVCRRGQYYIDMAFIPGKGSISRIYKWFNNKRIDVEIYNPNNIIIDWESEFSIPSNLIPI